MGGFAAIAGVSRSLRTLLLDRMEIVPAQVAVTIAPPDVTIPGIDEPRLNLYLYQVKENAHLRNQEIPGRETPGAYGRPPLSLNLHYLITAFASDETVPDGDLQAQEVLGAAMRALHDHAIVTEDLTIQRGAVGTVGDPILDTSLLDEYEQVKIALEPASLEEFSKIWSALPEANFRRSVAYEVSVAQIESRRTRRVPGIVRTRRVAVGPFARPRVAAVYRTPAAPGDPIGDVRVAAGGRLTIEGTNFRAARTWVRLGTLEPIGVVPALDVRTEKIELIVPDDQYPPDPDHPAARPIPAERRLQPGPQIVEVITRLDAEAVAGGLDRGAVEPGRIEPRSNQAAFLLVPRITLVEKTATVLRVTGTRLYREGLSTLVLVGDTAIEVRRSPTAAWADPTPTVVEIPLAALAAAEPPVGPGTHQVRVMVNGAQSTEEDKTVTLP